MTMDNAPFASLSAIDLRNPQRPRLIDHAADFAALLLQQYQHE
jgi:hypothetical protein